MTRQRPRDISKPFVMSKTLHGNADVGNGHLRYAWTRLVRATTTVATTAITATAVTAATVIATAATIIAIATAVAVVVAITAVITAPAGVSTTTTPACISTATTIGRGISGGTLPCGITACRCLLATENEIEDEKNDRCQNEAKHVYPFIRYKCYLFVICNKASERCCSW